MYWFVVRVCFIVCMFGCFVVLLRMWIGSSRFCRGLMVVSRLLVMICMLCWMCLIVFSMVSVFSVLEGWLVMISSGLVVGICVSLMFLI